MTAIPPGILAATMVLASPALAQPTELTPAQMDEVTAGVGANGAGVLAWNALGPMGVALAINVNAANGVAHSGSLNVVLVPGTVPNSICVGYFPNGAPPPPPTPC